MRIAWFAVLPLLAACNSTPSAVHEGSISRIADRNKPDTPALPPPDSTRAAAVNAQADTLVTAKQVHLFSQPGGKPDVFRLVLRGPSVLEGAATFTITDASGQVIFRESLSAADLEAPMVYEMKTPTATPAEREAFMRRRIREFFRPAQFSSPAVPTAAPYPTGPEAPDHATWNDLRKRPDSIRFTYLVGKEDRRSIAWSPLKKQVVRL
ncbi:hypothetical protein AUC43_09815 [Hymenobacter sedentarius]|uniref:Lipoprotein n=1 Tax=Hymenobacter sedentarius TaxID=1411621 RepID=A0A0U3SGS2_9BACT|nr:hypothetical protein [Hymenobacter sedentarius]ALW85364.1 hypothetical protein AUC43_09815 [Hymenobacter sedentarius]